MGKAATFGISLDSPAAIAGTTVKGQLFAHVEEEIAGAEWDVMLRGRERTLVQYQESYENANGNRSYRTLEANATRSLIQLKLPISDLKMIQEGDKISPGKYVLPFEVELPGSMPASFSLSYGGSHCHVEYSIKAILKGSGTLWNYDCEKFIVVQAKPLQEAPIPYNGPAVNESVSTCCCCHRGSMTFGAKLDDTCLARNSSFQVSMSCRNNTTDRIQSVKAKLLQVCTWNAGSGHVSTTTRQLADLDFTQDLGDRLKPQARLLTRGESLRDELVQVFREVNEGSYQGQVVVPLDALNSYSGLLIKIGHQLSIQLDTGSCRSHPEMIIPLLVGEPQRTSGEGSSNSGPLAATTAATSPTTVPPSGFVEQATHTATIHAPLEHAEIGGPAKVYEQDEEIALEPTFTGVMLNENDSAKPSLDTLLKEMKDSVADWDIINPKLRHVDWVNLFQSMSSSDYGKIIEQVDMDFDQVKVAEALANAISNFSCAYVVVAIRKSTEWNRPMLCERLLPYCNDLSQNQATIKAELTEWELLSTERAFSNALAAASK